MRAFLLLALSAAACGSPDCQESDLDGTYLMTLAVISGNCGAFSSTLAQYSKGVEVDSSGDCTDNYTRWDTACKQEAQSTCVDTANDLTIKVTGVIEEKDSSGSDYKGTATIEVTKTSTGAAVCSGTYSMEAKRQ